MKRIAIVNQRYGLEVNGGSEYYARLIAEHLNKYYNVEVLTTTHAIMIHGIIIMMRELNR